MTQPDSGLVAKQDEEKKILKSKMALLF